MATVSFAEAAKAPAPSEQQTKPEAQSTALAVQSPSAGVIGEITRDDIQTPRLNLVGKTGDLADSFKPGNFVYNKQQELTGPLTVVAVTIMKRYIEAVAYGSEERPRSFDTAEEVKAAGLRVGQPSSNAYGEDAVPIAEILFFVEKPASVEDPEGNFSTLLPSGRTGTLALFTARGSSYRSTAGQIFTAAQNNKHVKENGIWAQSWKLQSSLAKNDKNSWWTAQLLPAAKLSQEDADFLGQFAVQ